MTNERKCLFSSISEVQNGNPYTWIPGVAIGEGSNPGQLDVKFTLSPPSFNFTLFKIILERKKKSSDIPDIDFADINQIPVNTTYYETKVYMLSLFFL